MIQTALNLIEKANLDGTQRGVVISSGTHKPRGIVLDPHDNKMYFSDISDTVPSIQRARMTDGYYREIIVRDGLERPNSLAIDFEQSVSFNVVTCSSKLRRVIDLI